MDPAEIIGTACLFAYFDLEAVYESLALNRRLL